MKRIANWRFVAYFTFLAFIFLVLKDFVSNNLLAGMCHNTVIREILSPTRGYKAVVFQRDCGATTGYSTQVSVLPARESLQEESGNIFVIDADDDDVPSSASGGPEVSASWINPTQLKIIYDHRARIFNKQTQRHLVSIAYEAN